MKNANVAIFIPFYGCPHKCSFCDQNNITGIKESAPDELKVRGIIENSLKFLGENIKNSEIAFFGGTFTAIDKDYMIMLLKIADEYVKKYSFKGIRVSTRPDAINEEILTILKKYNVTSIELGAQSMDDTVLLINNRGHTSQDTINASKKIKKFGFSLGLQMMAGLYGDNDDACIDSAHKMALLEPDTMRIYPCVIIKGTMLQNLYTEKKYIPLNLEQAVDLCSKLILFFNMKKINIIRVGLHCENELIENIIAGPYHPAFRELCDNKIYADIILNKINSGKYSKNLNIFVGTKELSKAIGQKKGNLKKLNDLGYNAKFFTDDNLKKHEIIINSRKEF